MKHLFKMSVAGLLTAGLVACSSSPNYQPAQVTWVKHKPIQFKPATAADLPQNAMNLVFFREKDGLDEQTAVNIGVNDRYETSLRGGNYTAVPSCAGGTKISTAMTRLKINNLEYNPNVFDFAPATNQYFQVSVGAGGKSVVKQVTEQEALQRLADKQLQTHMVNRTAAKGCRPYEPRRADPVPVDPLKLFGVYYFDFDIPTLSAAERQRAFNLGKKILSTGKAYEVYLSGHADPMGTKNYNRKLSRKRAIDVAKVLEQAGVNPAKIKLGSFGHSQPVVLECQGIKARATRNGCNLKNRRVEALVKLDGVSSTMEDIDKIR